VYSEEQDYIPGTEVIRNLIQRSPSQPLGTPSQRVLDQAEDFYVSSRLAELISEPITGTERFTFTRMREIHRHLFQDVYGWAGTPRYVEMTKRGTDYAHPHEMNGLLRQRYGMLARHDYLRGIPDQGEFADQLAQAWAEINHAHVFREGNTRSQSVFFLQLTKSAGWDLDVARFAPSHPRSVYQEFVAARFDHQAQRDGEGANAAQASQKLAEVLRGVLSPDSSPEGGRRRGEPQRARSMRGLLRRFPELQDVALDQVGGEAQSTPEDDLQR